MKPKSTVISGGVTILRYSSGEICKATFRFSKLCSDLRHRQSLKLTFHEAKIHNHFRWCNNFEKFLGICKTTFLSPTLCLDLQHRQSLKLSFHEAKIHCHFRWCNNFDEFLGRNLHHKFSLIQIMLRSTASTKPKTHFS